VTDQSLPPDAKEPYRPDRALQQAAQDAAHFVGVVRDTLVDRPGGLVVAAYDTELFGHWWHEGPSWLGQVLELVAADPSLRTTTLVSRLVRRPPQRRLTLPESSWGYAKGHASWVTEETRPVWITLRATTARARAALAGGRGTRTLRCALARELALLHASDWPFMMTRGRSPGYALERIAGHADRVHRLCDTLSSSTPDSAPGSTPDDGTTLSGEALHDEHTSPVPPDPSAFLAALDPDGPERSGA
jgi:1,4-alpha-glucan branching enzyme